jgi:streptogramin lyase
MTGVYVSYRRGGPSMWAAERLVDRLSQRLGPTVSVTAADRLLSGRALVGAVREAMQGCSVLVAVIGSDWLEAAEFLEGVAGVRRMDDPDDPVRLEIRTANELGLDLIPVLVDGVPMPASTDVPGDVRPLLRRHSLPLSAARFDRDADRLVERLRVVLGLRDRERIQRRRRLAGAATAAVAVAGLAGYALSRDDPLPSGVAGTIDLDTGVGDIAVAPDGTVWVADQDQNELVRIDPSDPEALERVRVGEAPMAVAATAVAVWVANGSDGTITRVDPDSMEVVDTFTLGFEHQGQRAFFDPELTLVATEEAAWVTAGDVDGIRRLDVATGEQTTLPAPGTGEVTSVAVAGSSLWATDGDERSLFRVNATDGSVLETVPVSSDVSRVVVATDVWAVSENETVVRVDADSGAVDTVSTRLRSQVDDIAGSGDGVWVTADDDTVSFVRPSAGSGYDHHAVSLPDGSGLPDEEARAFVAAADQGRAWAVTSGGLVVEIEGPDG